MWDIISMSSGLLYIIPLILFMYTKKTTHILGFTGLITTLLSSEFIKRYIIGTKSKRPQGATNCNINCSDGDQSGKPGMPSSHTAITSFFVVYYFNKTNNIWIKLSLLSYLGLVGASRYLKRCHTSYQIGGGLLYGSVLALLFK